MNIFVLDWNFQRNAQYHVDKWIVKMPLETAQILCTVLHKNNISAPYKPTHQNHGCVLWAGESTKNFDWLCHLGEALCNEYTYRFDKKHKCEDIIKYCRENFPKIRHSCFTPHYLAMPDQYKSNNVVESYRNYCISEKGHLTCWKKRNRPEWWKEKIKSIPQATLS